jgi:hypothetical protein
MTFCALSVTDVCLHTDDIHMMEDIRSSTSIAMRSKVMRDLRKTAVWLGLFGSVSLLSLSATAQDATTGSRPDIPHPVIADALQSHLFMTSRSRRRPLRGSWLPRPFRRSSRRRLPSRLPM